MSSCPSAPARVDRAAAAGRPRVADRTDRVDRLSALLDRFELRAQAVQATALDGTLRFDAEPGMAWLHVLCNARARLVVGRARARSLPPVVAVLAAGPHRLQADGPPGAECLSARIGFGAPGENPLLGGLPDALVVSLDVGPGGEDDPPASRGGGDDDPAGSDRAAAGSMPHAAGPSAQPPWALTLQSLLAEVRVRRCGHGAVVQRLTEVFVVQVLRLALERRLVDGGVVGGLSDARLARAIAAVHAEPAGAWTLDTLASRAGMSRARFAAHFHRIIGMPPATYVARWRIGLAQSLLRGGRPVKAVAAEVGYGSASALGRAFTQLVGSSPRAWLAQREAASRSSAS